MQSMKTLMLVLPGGAGDAELHADGREQFLHRELGIEDVGDVTAFRNLLEQAARDRGLAGADFPGEQYEPAFATDPIEQMRQRILVALAQLEIARRWRDGERGFSEAEVIQIHRGHGVAAELKSICLIAEALQACRWSK